MVELLLCSNDIKFAMLYKHINNRLSTKCYLHLLLRVMDLYQEALVIITNEHEWDPTYTISCFKDSAPPAGADLYK